MSNNKDKRNYKGYGDPEEVFPQDFTEEYEEGGRPSSQARKRRKRKKKHYFLKLLLLIVIGVAVYFLLHSPLFDIDTIKTEGNSHFTAQELQKITGIKKGDNSFEISKGSMEKRLMEEPYIQEVEISRNLPKGITLSIKERKAQAVIEYNDEYILIDSGGVALESREKRPKLTQFLSLTVEEVKLGEPIKVKEEVALEKSLELLRAMKDGNLYFKKIKITGVMARGYITNRLICKGKLRNVIANIENGNLQKVIYDLRKKEKKKGIIYIGEDQYCSFQPKLK